VSLISLGACHRLGGRGHTRSRGDRGRAISRQPARPQGQVAFRYEEQVVDAEVFTVSGTIISNNVGGGVPVNGTLGDPESAASPRPD
jgi:hypothetical protein